MVDLQNFYPKSSSQLELVDGSQPPVANGHLIYCTCSLLSLLVHLQCVEFSQCKRIRIRKLLCLRYSLTLFSHPKTQFFLIKESLFYLILFCCGSGHVLKRFNAS